MALHHCCSRRQWLSAVGATAAGAILNPFVAHANDLPTSPVAVAKCQTYGAELLPALATMFDQLGGLQTLVAGKTVAIKINMVGGPTFRLGDLPPEVTFWTHPALISAAVSLISRAGASRIRVLECCGDTLVPFESYLSWAGWNPADILNAAPHVELENTNGLGSGTAYSRVICPGGGLVFPGFDLNHSYVEDCDVLISMPKMKRHRWFGVTLAMKNCYGMTPLSIYGDTAGIDAPGTTVSGTRVTIMHNGERGPSFTAPQEVNPTSPRDPGYRLPRIINDVVSARPIHLAIIDGIQTMTGAEGPWYTDVEINPVNPGVLVAGYNPVCTDAVAMAIMGFDPMAQPGTPPFELCDNYLAFAEQLGLGTRDLSRIPVLGTPIKDARFDFRSAQHPPGPRR